MPRVKKVTKATKERIEEEKKPKRVRRDYIYAVGRRKCSVSRVRLYKKGEGEIIINEKPFDKYFTTYEFRNIIIKPLEATGQKGKIKITVKVEGGGVRGQAESVRHGISRALILLDKDYRKTLKPLGFLKRDPRKKERKKPGLKRARRAPQFSKR
ncbi:30S ribosomal protein S9 [Patescibacteria group bacterium]|nr:30S ribosomal protein S9 [Patescibacteria group bacterium]